MNLIVFNKIKNKNNAGYQRFEESQKRSNPFECIKFGWDCKQNGN